MEEKQIKCSCGNVENIEIQSDQETITITCPTCGREKKIQSLTDFDLWVTALLVNVCNEIREARIAFEFEQE